MSKASSKAPAQVFDVYSVKYRKPFKALFSLESTETYIYTGAVKHVRECGPSAMVNTSATATTALTKVSTSNSGDCEIVNTPPNQATSFPGLKVFESLKKNKICSSQAPSIPGFPFLDSAKNDSSCNNQLSSAYGFNFSCSKEKAFISTGKAKTVSVFSTGLSERDIAANSQSTSVPRFSVAASNEKSAIQITQATSRHSEFKNFDLTKNNTTPCSQTNSVPSFTLKGLDSAKNNSPSCSQTKSIPSITLKRLDSAKNNTAPSSQTNSIPSFTLKGLDSAKNNSAPCSQTNSIPSFTLKGLDSAKNNTAPSSQTNSVPSFTFGRLDSAKNNTNTESQSTLFTALNFTNSKGKAVFPRSQEKSVPEFNFSDSIKQSISSGSQSIPTARLNFSVSREEFAALSNQTTSVSGFKFVDSTNKSFSNDARSIAPRFEFGLSESKKTSFVPTSETMSLRGFNLFGPTKTNTSSKFPLKTNTNPPSLTLSIPSLGLLGSTVKNTNFNNPVSGLHVDGSGTSDTAVSDFSSYRRMTGSIAATVTTKATLFERQSSSSTDLIDSISAKNTPLRKNSLCEIPTLEELRNKFLTLGKPLTALYSRNPYASTVYNNLSTYDTLETEAYLNSNGQYERCVPHGKGVLKNAFQQVIYEGEWLDGKRSGVGSAHIVSVETPFTLNSGFYQGEWNANMRQGHGYMTFLSGAEYSGEWLYDRMHGVGIMKFPDGAILQGQWVENQPHGCCVLTWPNGRRKHEEYRHGNIVLSTGATYYRGDLSDNDILEDNRIYKLQLESEIRRLSRKLKGEEQNMLEKMENLRNSAEQSLESLKKRHEQELRALKENFEAEKDDLKRSFIKEKSEVVMALTDDVQAGIKKEQELQNQLQEEKATKLCRICLQEERSCVLIPCLHFLYCPTCIDERRDKSEKAMRCPACNCVIAGQMDCKLSL